jgi:putative restriction endonuclease
MSPDPVLAAFSRLRVWERDGQRAPHKPLLVLLTLGCWVRGDRGPYRYADGRPRA